jgi:NAD+ kinase
MLCISENSPSSFESMHCPEKCNKKMSQLDDVDIVQYSSENDRWIQTSPVSQHRVHLLWGSAIRTVFVVKKHRSAQVTQQCVRVCCWLAEQNVRVFIEPNSLLPQFESRFELFDSKSSKIDLCICIGGDGTLLHLNSLFQKAGVPPVIAFAMGTLSFLTHFDLLQFEKRLLKLLKLGHVESVPVALRMRLNCRVYSPSKKLLKEMQVLNELVVDRGSSSFLVKVELYVDGEFVTLVKADGLIISTPTGSTAYSMSAGGSMVAPSVPAILITPICPHSLSFRPLIIPDSSTIMLRIPDSRESEASAGFDGRHAVTLSHGSTIEISASKYPMATIGFGGYNHDWFQSLKSKLNWNENVTEPEYRSNL